MRRLIALLLSLLMLASCASAHDDSIRFGLSRFPVTLDPRQATDAASSRINRLLYQRLVDFDDQYRPVPSLATWQELSPIHYRFTLGRKGREFSNGTSADVKATYDYILDPANASPHRVSLNHIRSIRTPDKDHVDFYLSRADALFPGRLVIGIVPAQVDTGKPLNRFPVGSGTFDLHSWTESVLQLVRRRDGQVVEFVEVPDPTVRVLRLLKGEVDIIQNDLPPEMISYLSTRHSVTVLRGPGTNYAYLGFNMQDPSVGQLRVRQAIASAIDRQAIIKYVLNGAARPASAILTPDHWAGDPFLERIPYDPDRARKIMHDLGYSKQQPLHLVYKTSTDPFRLRLATIIQQQLADVGIDVELRSYDWGTFYSDIKNGRFQMYSLMWVGVKLPDIFRYVYYSGAVPPAGANRGRFVDHEVDRLIDEADALPTMSAQAAVYRRIQGLVHRQLPYVPLWYEDHVAVMRNDIKGYVLAKDGNYDGLKSVLRTED